MRSIDNSAWTYFLLGHPERSILSFGEEFFSHTLL